MKFEWDARKAEANQAKYGIDFDEALLRLRFRSIVAAKSDANLRANSAN